MSADYYQIGFVAPRVALEDITDWTGVQIDGNVRRRCSSALGRQRVELAQRPVALALHDFGRDGGALGCRCHSEE